MIWGDDWTQIATQKSDVSGRFCTSLVPPRTALSAGVQFRVVTGEPTQDWLDLVSTRWTIEEAALRLADARVPCLFEDGVLVATCVLRFLTVDDIWVLETLSARKADVETALLIGEIDVRLPELQQAATERGVRLYADKPGVFAKRLA